MKHSQSDRNLFDLAALPVVGMSEEFYFLIEFNFKGNSHGNKTWSKNGFRID